MLLALLLGACQPLQEHANGTDASGAPAHDAGRADATANVGERLPTLDVGPADASAPIRMQVGQALRIHLPASSAGGYGWELEQDPARFMSIEADPGGDPLTLTRPGSDSRFMSWRFRAKGTGRTLLKFRYGRPWETGADAGRTETFHIDVR